MQDDRYENEPRFFSAPRSQEDVTVRPRSLDDFIGQERVREKLESIVKKNPAIKISIFKIGRAHV